MELQAKAGGGAFQWNRGGWFGGQVGGTLWLVLLGLALLAKPQAVGSLVILLGLIPNGIGLLLWRQRFVRSPYPALQALVAVCGLAALAAIVLLRISGVGPASTGLPRGPWFLLIYPGLMLAFHLQERRARRAAR